MSAIAFFYRLPLTALDSLRRAASDRTYFSSLRQLGTEVTTYQWSGYVIGTMLPYLQQRRGVDVMKSEWSELDGYLTQVTGATHFIFTDTHRTQYMDKLNSELFDEEELRLYYDAFNGCDEPNMGKAMLDGIVAIRESMASLKRDEIILFIIA